MEYLVIIPTIYLLIECIKTDIELKRIKKESKCFMGVLDIFSGEERIEVKKSLTTDIRDSGIMVIGNNILMLCYIAICCAIIIFWDYKPFYMLTRAFFISLFLEAVLFKFVIKFKK